MRRILLAITQLPSVVRALRHRDYRLFVVGQLVSLIGTWMQSVAQAWLVYGVLMAASGLGALVSALTLATRGGVRGLGRWVALSSAGFGVSLVLFALSRWFWLSASLLLPVGVGFAMMMQLAASNTLIQAMVPDQLRGRVMAVYSMMLLGLTPFGALLAGALAERLGAPGTVASGGLICVGGAAVFAWYLPAMRVEARRLIAVQDELVLRGDTR